MRRVLLMIDEAQVGGGQRHVLDLAARMKRFEPHVACESSGYLVDELKARNVPVHSLRMTNRPSIVSLRKCRELLLELRPAVVHTHGGTAGFTGRIASLGVARRKVVHTYHGLHYLHAQKGVRNAAFRMVDAALLRVTDRIICVAGSDFDLGLRFGVVDRKKSVVIRNGIDTAHFEKGPSKGRGAGSVVVGTIGRLHVQKGHSVLLHAAAELKRMGKNLVTRIIGDGELKGNLEALATELGVKDMIEFRRASKDVAGDLAQMDIFVLPSLWEGLPLVLLEAMAAGVPVVASRVDGVSEIISDGREGFLVPASQPAALASAIARLIDDRDLAAKLASSATEKVRKEFSVDRMVRQTEDLYEEVLQEGI